MGISGVAVGISRIHGIVFFVCVEVVGIDDVGFWPIVEKGIFGYLGIWGMRARGGIESLHASRYGRFTSRSRSRGHRRY